MAVGILLMSSYQGRPEVHVIATNANHLEIFRINTKFIWSSNLFCSAFVNKKKKHKQRQAPPSFQVNILNNWNEEYLHHKKIIS